MNVLRSLGGWGRLARPPRWQAFVGWQMYYLPYLGRAPQGSQSAHALIQHDGPLVGDAARQADLADGLAAGRRAALVWAPPGCGKSRFALELARRLEKGRDRWRVLFVHHEAAIVRQELDQLSQSKRVVLIVDDAHECPDIVKHLADVSARSSPVNPISLVCMTRTTGRAQVLQALNSEFAAGEVQELDLGRPPTPLVRSLIDQLLPKSSPMHRDTIARFVRQSYFGAVLVCRLLGRESKLPQSFQRQDLRERICRQTLAEAAKDVCPVEAALRVLAVYAALCAVLRTDAPVRALASQLSELAPEKVDVLLDRVLAAGLFQDCGGERIRPVPDLFGDLILEEACLDAYGKPTPYSARFLAQVFELDPIAAVANCADIGQLFGGDQDVDLVSTLMLDRARSIPRENKSEVMKLLHSCQPLTARRPRVIVELARILEERGILRRHPSVAELRGSESVEWATCALLMSAGEIEPSALPAALKLGRDLYAAVQSDEQARQRVRQLLEDCCRFEVGRSATHAKAVAETLRAWVAESDVQAAALAASLSGQFLAARAGAGDHPEQVHDTEPVPAPLSPVPEVWAVRDIAVDTLVRATEHADATVHFAAIAAIDRYASHESMRRLVPMDSWRPQLAREIGLLSAAIIKLAKASPSLPVCACAELQGWLWWVEELDVLHRTGATMLQSIPDGDAYRLWKSLHDQRLPMRVVVPGEPGRTSGSRLAYFQSLSALNEEKASDRARELFDALDPSQADLSSWRALWLGVLDQSPRVAVRAQAAAVVSEFVRRHAKVAWSFVNETDAGGPLAAVLPLILAELRKQDRAGFSQATPGVPAATRLEDAWLQVLWGVADLDEVESAMLARGLESTDPQVQHQAAGALLHAEGADRVSAFRRVFATLAQQPADVVLWDLVIGHFVHWTEGVLPSQLEAPTQAMGQVADDLIVMLQTYGPHLRWGYQQHTRQLSKAFAIMAIVSPQHLQAWMQQAWSGSQRREDRWNDESPLGITRLVEIVRSIRASPAATYWADVFVQWISRSPELGSAGALGLKQLCALNDAAIGQLAEQIGQQPTDTAVQSFIEFVQHHKSDHYFARKALEMLDVWMRFPECYARIEAVIVDALVNGGGGGRNPGQPSPTQARALQAIEARRSQGDPSPALLATLERAEREIRSSMADDSARDEDSAQS